MRKKKKKEGKKAPRYFINIHLTKSRDTHYTAKHTAAKAKIKKRKFVPQILEAEHANNKYSMQGCQQLMVLLSSKHPVTHRNTENTGFWCVTHLHMPGM